MKNILDEFKITSWDLTNLTTNNPSLKGFLMGYVSELQLQKKFFPDTDLDYSQTYKPLDSNRLKRCDLATQYKNREFLIECKSLVTDSIFFNELTDSWETKFACKASCKRNVTFPDGTVQNSSSYLFGTFDILAINLFCLNNTFDYVFIKNSSLPKNKNPRYTEYQRNCLINSYNPLIISGNKVKSPFYNDPKIIMDQILEEEGKLSKPIVFNAPPESTYKF